MQIRWTFPDISYLSETQKNNFQFLYLQHFLLVLLLSIFKRLRFQLIKFHSFRLWRALWRARRRHDIQKQDGDEI